MDENRIIINVKSKQKKKSKKFMYFLIVYSLEQDLRYLIDNYSYYQACFLLLHQAQVNRGHTFCRFDLYIAPKNFGILWLKNDHSVQPSYKSL